MVQVSWSRVYLCSSADDLEWEVFSYRRKVLVVMQQLAVILQRRGSNDAIVGLADGNAFLAQFAVDIRCPHKYRLWHRQHNQRAEIAPNAPVGGVIGNPLENLGEDDTAQGQVLVIEDALLQYLDMRQVTTCEEADPDAGVNQDH